MSKIAIANWKMNLSQQESVALGEELAAKMAVEPLAGVEVAVCPSFTALAAVKAVLGVNLPAGGQAIALGAQDVFWEEKGAFTSGISPQMLKEVGCQYTLIGHSERRQNMGETDEMVNRKVLAAVKADLIPVICVGETWEERQAGQQDLAIARQVAAALRDLKSEDIKKIIIAYEPVWVIGTGQAITPEQALYAVKVIRQQVGEGLGMEILSEKLQVLYGGSVSSNNVADFTGQDEIDGVLVGNKGLKVVDFYPLLQKIVA